MPRTKSSILLAAFSIAAIAHTPVAAQSCSATISSISFGSSVDVLPGAAIDTTGTLTVSCTGTAGRTVRICANIGRRNPNAPNDDSSRRMQGSSTGTFLNHEFYSDSGRSTRWGSWDPPGYATAGVQFDVPLNSAGSGSVGRTIYARILASQPTTRPDTYVMTLSGSAHSFSYQYVSTTTPSTPTCPFTPWISYASSTVTATIPGLCYMNLTNVSFGNHATLMTSAITASGAVRPQCSSTLPYTVSLGGGLSGATNPALRKMANGSLQVTYGLYRDPGYSLPWGSTAGVNVVTGTGTGLSQSITVYGQIPVQTIPGGGTYADSVVVTVTY